MPNYSIPDEFIDGFETISKLSENELNALGLLLKEHHINDPFDMLMDKGNSLLSSISHKDFKIVIKSLISIINIFAESNDIDRFTSNFAKSYLYSKVNATEEDSLRLKKKLSFLLENFKNISIAAKGQVLLTENYHNFKDARIISDVRILFDNELDLSEKEAFIVHNLKIQYFKGREPREFFITLDLSDLKKLKSVVERAINKDEKIKAIESKYNFIDFNNADSTND